jgi:hypothetical protein
LNVETARYFKLKVSATTTHSHVNLCQIRVKLASPKMGCLNSNKIYLNDAILNSTDSKNIFLDLGWITNAAINSLDAVGNSKIEFVVIYYVLSSGLQGQSAVITFESETIVKNDTPFVTSLNHEVTFIDTLPPTIVTSSFFFKLTFNENFV